MGTAHALDSACQAARPTSLGRGALPGYDTCQLDNMTGLTTGCACASAMLTVRDANARERARGAYYHCTCGDWAHSVVDELAKLVQQTDPMSWTTATGLAASAGKEQ